MLPLVAGLALNAGQPGLVLPPATPPLVLPASLAAGVAAEDRQSLELAEQWANALICEHGSALDRLQLHARASTHLFPALGMLPFVSPMMMRNAAAAGVWTSVRSMSPATQTDAWSGYTLRERLTAAGLTDATGTQLRFRFKSSTSSALNIAKAYVQVKGAGTYDFNSAPVQLLFGGSASASVGISSDIQSDGVVFAYSGTSDLVVSIYHSTTAGYQGLVSTPTTSTVAYKLGDDATTLVASGYTVAATTDIITLVEALV